MKILLYTDVHVSKTSSIIRAIGENYSIRLENIIKSVSWAEQLALEKGCDQIICLGDFFDKPDASAQELTAVRDIKWVNLPHIFIVGNHESDSASLKYSSTKALESAGFEIINKPETKNYGENTQITFLPYIKEELRQPIDKYNKIIDSSKKQICLSHNDIKGINYGVFTTKEGFTLDEINNNYDLFINGHIHNGQWLNKHVLNLGNLTGQNSNEDAFKYSHNIAILDTDTLQVELIENPYAFNFYKLEIDKEQDINFDSLKNNSVVIIKCDETLRKSIEKHIYSNSKIIASKIINKPKQLTGEKESQDLPSIGVDHLKQFRDFCLERLGDTKVVREELEEVTK